MAIDKDGIHERMNDTELDGLLAAKARAGNMRAIELLWRRVPVAPVTASELEAPPGALAQVIALADRGGKA